MVIFPSWSQAPPLLLAYPSSLTVRYDITYEDSARVARSAVPAMRAIRSSDGSSYPITHLKPSTSAAEFFDALSAVSSIPVLALIVMHPSGRQVDNESITALLKEPEDVESQERTAYLFDREILNVDLQGAEGQQLYEALQIDKERVLEDTHGDRELLALDPYVTS